MGTRYRGITRAVYGPEVCWLTAGLTAFSNNDLNRDQFLVKFSEKIPGRSVENQHYWTDKCQDKELFTAFVRQIAFKGYANNIQFEGVKFGSDRIPNKF